MKNDNFINFFWESIKNINSVYHISVLDVNLKYRRTVLGNIWIILTYLITVSVVSLVWSTILNASITEYFPKLFIGFTVFYLILSFTSQASEILYAKYKGIILSLGISLNNVILRHLTFIVLEYIQFVPVYLIIVFLAGIKLSLNTLLFIPGMLLVFANGYWMIFLISLLCARFRDVGIFLSAIMSASFLLTPIIWDKNRLGQYENLVYLNPFTSMVEAIRDPLLGLSTNPIIYVLLFSYLIIGFVISSIFYKYKNKLFNFWI